jgi:hypothetical protein
MTNKFNRLLNNKRRNLNIIYMNKNNIKNKISSRCEIVLKCSKENFLWVIHI